MATQPKTHLTPEQYLEIERKAEYKSEYFRGEMYAMSGAREGHNLVASNLNAELVTQLRKRPCKAYMSDMRVHIASTGLYTYPDASALCGEPQFLDDTRDTLLNPQVIVEVLSPSTEAYDRGRKFGQYRTIPSLREYLLISSERMSVEHFTRGEDGAWILRARNNPQDVVELTSLSVRIALADLYDKVDFAPEPEEELKPPPGRLI